MPVSPTYPGVYIQELPSGNNTIAGVATSITAFAGYVGRGPVNTPVQIQNYGDFQRAFGGLDTKSELSYQVSQFFTNGGSNAYVVRVPSSAHPPTTAATPLATWAFPAATPRLTGPTVTGVKAGGAATFAPLAGVPTAGAGVAMFQAANPGQWGGNVAVQIGYPLTAAVGGAAATPPVSGLTTPFNLTAIEMTATGPVRSVASSMTLSPVTMGAQSTNLWAQLAGLSTPLLGIPPAQWQTAMQTALASSLLAPNGTVLVVGANAAMPAGTAMFAFALGTLGPGKPPAATWVASTTYIPYSSAIAGPSGFEAALRSALASAMAQIVQPQYANAFSKATVSVLYVDAAGNHYVQIAIADPNYANYYLSVSVASAAVSPPAPFLATALTNVQAYQLTSAFDDNYSFVDPSSVAYPPSNGAVPSGSDSTGPPLQAERQGIYAMEDIGLFNLMSLPDLRLFDGGDYFVAATNATQYCQQRMAFLILDMPSTVTTPQQAVTWVSNVASGFASSYAAAYFPEVLIPDPLNNNAMRSIGVSGTMAGVYASTDVTRGVWKAPAGINAKLAGVQQVMYALTNQENGLINPLGLNALRTFPVYGNIGWGARTLFGNDIREPDDYKYVPVRRLALYIEQSLVPGLQWVVFEPNDERLWTQIRLTVNSFMQQLFQAGAFAGSTPDEAYAVVCDASTTTKEDMANGIVNILVMFAPVEPAEFVIVTIQQMAGQGA